ncbi:DUF7666 domain-containing protein [Chitinolyticbacter meiyuanensis]|uniref:DUF7666 domain-containing protein n=1 Tax=Chitinolyticbacter meiyuanensis TaxID=682798 RepID=UPI0011E5D8AE|nr:hypothetical protein [Chitinolyticbacter meiyuanensis]
MAARKKKAVQEEVITSYKGFDANWQCRGFQFAVGGKFKHDGEVKACASGFHACEYPLDVFKYYSPAGSKFAVVSQSGDLARHADDSKVASKKLEVKAELSIAGLVKAAIEFTTSKCLPIDPESPASSTGYQGAASSTGDYGAASSTGYQGAASSTGDYGAASSTGYQGAASSTGDYGAASSTGYQGAASSTGYQGAASSTGDYGAASSTGDYGAASSTGYQGAASSTGDYGAASSTGDYGAASSTGDYGAASSTGKHAVALAAGREGRAMATESGAIVLLYRNDDGEIVHIRASKVGENGIKANVFYMLNADGEFVEA